MEQIKRIRNNPFEIVCKYIGIQIKKDKFVFLTPSCKTR